MTDTKAENAAQPKRRRIVSGGGLWNAFKTFAILFSFAINFVLVIALLLILPNVPGVYKPVKSGLLNPVVGGLYNGFGKMNQAQIVRTIEVHDSVPAHFELPLDQSTTVELVEPVALNVPAVVSLGPGNVLGNANVSLVLPPGTKLPIHLKMTVPVSNSIPVDLKVNVNIPLSETDLGPQFQGFQKLFAPLDGMVNSMPDDWDGVVDCVLKGGVVVDCKPSNP